MRLAVGLLLAVLPWSLASAEDAWPIRLPASAAVAEHDGGWWWQPDGAEPAHLTGVDQEQRPLIATAAGTIAVHRALFADGGGTALAALPALIARAASAQVALDGAQLADGLLTGPQLRTASAIVLVDSVLLRHDTPKAERAEERQALATACAELGNGLADAGVDHLACKATITFLGLLSRERRLEGDDLDPAVARRLVHHGWLHHALPEMPAAATIERALGAALAPHLVTDWSGDGRRLAEWRDAFGAGGWTFSAPNRSAYARTHSRPENRDELTELQLVIELPSAADPLLAIDPLAARLHLGNRLLARWSRDHGFSADESLWRQVVPKASGDADLANALPPHLLVTSFSGDALLLVTAHGTLRPPADDTPAAGQRFITEAAAALPDAAHLDLIGEHLFTYAYDSPDTTRPLLIGNRTDKGDIHQTTEQTTATCTGGCMRGDCDDLAELYRDIAVLQKHIAHVIHLPGHAACAWTDHHDNQWTTFVLHTGRPLSFTADDLSSSVLNAYRHFRPEWAVSGDQIGVDLRFAGENTRHPYYLSARIFADAGYARTMIAVQRDWFMHTYHHGIATMRALVEAGDQDPANYEELAGLYRRVHRSSEAIEWKRRALAAARTPGAALDFRIDLIALLVSVGHYDEAEAEAHTALEHDLPALPDQSPTAVLAVLRRVHDRLHAKHHAQLRRTLLTERLAPPVIERLIKTRKWLATNFDPQRWDSEDTRQLRQQADDLLGDLLSLADVEGLAAVNGDEHLRTWLAQLEGWLSDLAAVEDEDPSFVQHAYADLGGYYERLLGRKPLLGLLLAIDPATAEPAPRHRIGSGLASVRIDLPGIRCSVPFWRWMLSSDLGELRRTDDLTPALRHLSALEAAYARCQQLELSSPQIEQSVREARLTAALLKRDAGAVRLAFAELRRLDDRNSYADAAQTVGGLAGWLPTDWFSTVVGLWHAEIAQPPDALAIAWAAANANAGEHALIAAQAAIDRYGAEMAVADELAFLSDTIELRKREQATNKKNGREPSKEPRQDP